METLLFLGQDLLLLLPYLTYQLQKLQILPLIRKTIYRPTHVEHFVIFGARFVVFVVPFFPFFLSSLYRIYSYIPTLSLKNNNNNNNNNNTHYFLRPFVSIKKNNSKMKLETNEWFNLYVNLLSLSKKNI